MTIALPAETQVVIIGGGIMGCSVAYHLAKSGCTDVVLLERKQLTSGTTWHSAAQVRQLRSGANLTQLIRHSAELYASLEAETGQATGWLKTGSLSIATNSDRFTHIKRQASLARLYGVEAHVIESTEAADRWPLMRSDDVIGAVFSPDDGRVNPSDVCAALIKAAKAAGVKVFEDAPVTGFEKRGGRVSAVITESGRIACQSVALCAGLWSRQVAALAGVTAPLYACEHFYMLTKPINGIDGHLPTLSDHDGHLYIRDDVGGLLVGCFEPGAKPLPLDALPPDFAFDLLNEDWDHFEPMMMNALHRLPVLETAEVRTLVNGPESFTPDGAFMLGESPDLDGFFLGCGMNSVGMASGGGAGRALAEWIIEGRPSMDLWEADPRRFQPFQNNLRALHDRIPEELGLHYAVSYPGREPETARNLRHTPLHDRLAAQGANFTQIAGWERPRYFDPAGEVDTEALSFQRPPWFERVAVEHRAAREGVALLDQSMSCKLRLEGPDAESVLQSLCANDMAVEPGCMVYTPMLNENGGYENDIVAIRLDEGAYLLLTGTAKPTRDKDWIRRNMPEGARATMSDVTSGMAAIGLSGPNARELLQRVSPDKFTRESFPFYWARQVEVGYARVLALRLSFAGELGWELYMPSEFATGVYDALTEAGADLGLANQGAYAMTSLRLEKGFRAWGHDLTPEDTPLEAGMAFGVKLDKGVDFIGRDAVLRQRDEGVKRRLVMLTLNDNTANPIGGEPILYNGEPVGQVTSAAFGHSVGTSVAMGYVDRDEAILEQMMAVGGFALDISCDVFSCTASLDPPYDPGGGRMRA